MDNGKRLLNEIFAEIGMWWTKRHEKISHLLPLFYFIFNFPIQCTQYFGSLLLLPCVIWGVFKQEGNIYKTYYIGTHKLIDRF
ncbi:MAG: hypothetical protein HW406_1973 [Candidatus Brocadiaceae bacterium]|nr:hypothetical protein [Candidatus Brocadiaceae bacterium]